MRRYLNVLAVLCLVLACPDPKGNNPKGPAFIQKS